MHRVNCQARSLVNVLHRVTSSSSRFRSAGALSQLQVLSNEDGARSSSLVALSAAFAAVALSSVGISLSESDQNDSWKVYTFEEVQKHKTKATGIWAVYKDGVYDITKFVANHPGGQDKIMLAAGGDIAPFWNLYRQHYNSALPMEILNSLRIGTLAAEDVRRMEAAKSPDDDKDPYNNDPTLSPVLRYLSRKPINAEPPVSLLTDSWVTPVELFFVRNHHPVVHVPNLKSYTVSVRRDKANPAASSNDIVLNLSVEDIKTKFKPHTVVATIQCGGNRRFEMSAIERTNGAGWNSAISTAEWKGARLRDILLAAGVSEEEIFDTDEGATGVDEGRHRPQHVHFLGADDMQASIPIRKALSREGDVLIAYEMNGAPIPPQHGAPLRAIVPGHVGVRNVKWVTGIVVSPEEADGPWQRGMAYKGFGPSVRSLEGLDVAGIPSLQEQPVQSGITVPFPSSGTSEGVVPITAGEPLTVKGYAYSGGGRGIIRVDVSIDGGKTWQVANLTDGTCLATPEPVAHRQPLDRSWAWTFWESDFDIPDSLVGQKLQIISKATDASYNVQPDSVQGVWNLRGINNNAWPRVNAEVVAAEAEAGEED